MIRSLPNVAIEARALDVPIVQRFAAKERRFAHYRPRHTSWRIVRVALFHQVSIVKVYFKAPLSCRNRAIPRTLSSRQFL